MKRTVRGPRSRWVGPPVSAPKSELGRSPSGRQRHYGAVELAGASEQVNVNDVVEVVENNQEETSKGHPVLAQVLSMWEDTFTGIFKFRARSLVQASDLPSDALARLQSIRQASAVDGSPTGSKASLNMDQQEAAEVFLTQNVKDLEVRSIVKPITLCVGTSATTDGSPGGRGKMGPRLTHAFRDASGEFQPLDGADPILKRARVRQANAAAIASRVDQENEAAKSGTPIVKSNGWLLPKRGALARREGRKFGRGAGGGVASVASSANSAGTNLCSPMLLDMKETSGSSETQEPLNSEDGEFEEDKESGHGDGINADSNSPRRSNPVESVGEGFTPRTSARQRKSQRSPSPSSPGKECFCVEPEADVCPPPSSPTPEAEVEDSAEQKNEGNACPRSSSPSPDAKAGDSLKASPEATVCPPSSTAASIFQRRRRVPLKKRQVPLPPRPRRLDMPPIAEAHLVSHVCEAPPHADVKSSVAAKVIRPVRTRMSLGLRPKSSPALPRSSSMGDIGKASPQLSVSAKRKRSVATKSSQGTTKSDDPPLPTPVGKDYQTDIPNLLSAEERQQPQTRTGAKMVWRGVHDWDPQSRGLLARYLRAAKGVVDAKQARPGVAVHVRLGGENARSGADQDDTTGITSSYAVWALSSGREACGLVRVACSETAQTDIPRSAIQRVQCQEQALSALVRARCVLDNFEPALQMLADDQASPESIAPWTMKQVRTLEKALVEDYDPSRRLHGWARPGMEMDREDFIDLATISKQVPGKTPTQVLSFYYRYLAAATPLTDVVYGPEAAKARKQEPISPVSLAHEANVVLPGIGQLTRGNANTAAPTMPASQTSPGLCEVSPANSSVSSSESAPKPKPRVVQLSGPKPAETVAANTAPNHGPAVDSVKKAHWSTRRTNSPPANEPASSAPKANSRSTIAFKHATNEATAGGGYRLAHANPGTGTELSEYGSRGAGRALADYGSSGTGRVADMQSGKGGGCGGASEYFAEQRRCAARGRQVSGTLPPLPSDAEVLEVDDSDDDDGADGTRISAVSASSGGEPARPSDIDTAAPHINSVARQMHRQAASPVEPYCRPTGVLTMAARAMFRQSDGKEGQRTRGSDHVGYGYLSEAPVFPSSLREAMGENPKLSQTTGHEQHMHGVDDRPGGGQVESDIPSSRFRGLGHSGQITGYVGQQPVSVDDTFGSMAPCWRLLERAQSYMDKNQLDYMRGLMLTQVKKPMSRDQLLERAESCLQDQDQIFGAFVKMFDRIDQPPQVPLYPAKKTLSDRPQPASYIQRRSLDADPIHTGPIYSGPHGLPPPQIPTNRTSKEQDGNAYSLRPINDGGDHGIPMTAPSQPYPHVGISVGGRAEVRRSIHPHNHNGAGGWRTSGLGTNGRNNAEGIRAEPPPRRLSAVSHPADRSVHPVAYPQSRPHAGHGGEARVRNLSSKQHPLGWRSGAGVLAAAATGTETPGSMTRTGCRGLAWGSASGGRRQARQGSPAAFAQLVNRKAPTQPPTGFESAITNTGVPASNLLTEMLSFARI